MITGFDTVLVSASPVGPAISGFLDGWCQRWPSMHVAVTGQHDSQFLEWPVARREIPVQRGEILVAKDIEMVMAWDEHGYEVPDAPEGPFGILYEPCPARVFTAVAQQDPYARGQEYGFEPYENLIVGRDLTLTTIVTPDGDSACSHTIIDAVVSALSTTAASHSSCTARPATPRLQDEA
jgi:hypothetical protein